MSDLIIFDNEQTISVSGDQAILRQREINRVYDAYLGMAIGKTKPQDWVDQNGKPYLTISGAEKVKNMFGVSVTSMRFEKEEFEDDIGKYIVFTCSAEFSWKMSHGEYVGTCSTRDKFFGMAQSQFKKLSEVDITLIKKKAMTNMMGRGIKAVLGVNNLTWDDLNLFGVEKSGSAKIDYRKPAQASAEIVSKKAELKKMILESVSGDNESARTLLKSMTTWTKSDGTIFEGKTDIDKLTEKEIDISISKLKKAVK